MSAVRTSTLVFIPTLAPVQSYYWDKRCLFSPFYTAGLHTHTQTHTHTHTHTHMHAHAHTCVLSQLAVCWLTGVIQESGFQKRRLFFHLHNPPTWCITGGPLFLKCVLIKSPPPPIILTWHFPVFQRRKNVASYKRVIGCSSFSYSLETKQRI